MTTDKTLAERRAEAIAEMRGHLDRERAALADAEPGQLILGWPSLCLGFKFTNPSKNGGAVCNPASATVLKRGEYYPTIRNGHGDEAAPWDRVEAIKAAIAQTEGVIAHLEQLARDAGEEV